MQRLVQFQFSFIVILLLAFSPVANALPTLVYPKQGMNVADTTIRFNWDAEAGATTYELQVARNSLFTTPDINVTALTGTSYSTAALGFGFTYYWRVRAVVGGTPTAWSPTGSFGHFLPTSFANLIFWIHADGPLVKDAGNFVSAWPSRSAAGDTVQQPDGLKRPQWVANGFNGKPMVHFDGVDDVLNGGDILNINTDSRTAYTFGRCIQGTFYAKSKLADAANRYAFYLQASASSMWSLLQSRTFAAGGNFTIPASPAITTFALYSSRIRRFATTYDNLLYRNGALRDSVGDGVPASYSFNSNYRFLVGGYNDANDVSEASGAFPLNGDIGEIFFYDVPHHDTTRVKLEKYVMDKYAPPVNLGENIVYTYGFCDTVLRAGKYFSTYLWSTGATDSVITVSAPGTYFVAVTDAFGRLSVDTVSVIKPNPSYTGPTAICQGSSVTWNSGLNPAAYTFLWTGGTTGPSLIINTAGNYTLTATDTNGCSFTTATVTFTVDAFQSNVDLGPDTAVCGGNLIGLQTGGNLVTTYNWSGGFTTSTIAVNTSGIYYVTVTSANGCTAVDSIDVTISGVGPTADFSADTVCLGQPTTFTDMSTIPLPYNVGNWVWHFGDGDSSLVQNPTHVYGAPGMYTVSLSASSDSGCTSTPITKTLYVRPVVQAFFSDSVACTGDATRFTDASIAPGGDSITSILWYFSPGNTGSTPTYFYQFPAVGSFPVSLIVNTNLGCADTFTRTVTVTDTSAPVSAFYLQSPLNNVNVHDSVMQFHWDSATNALRYRFEISRDTFFSNVIYSTDTTGTSVSVSSIPYSYATYYWRVTAFNLCGVGVTTTFHSFTHFNPSILGNKSFWVMADGQLVKTGANRVTQWQDQTGNGNNVNQTAGSAQPLWVDSIHLIKDMPVLRFDGGDFMDGGDILDLKDNSRTVFVIGKSVGSSGAYFAKSQLSGSPKRYGLYYNTDRLWLFNHDNFVLFDTVTRVPRDYELIEGITNRNTSLLTLFGNSVPLRTIGGVTDPNYDMDTTFRFLIGAYNDQDDIGQYAPFYLNGDIAEIIMFDTVLTQQEHDYVELYLYNKYSGPFSLGPDISFDYGFCNQVTLNATDRYVRYQWSTGDSVPVITVNRGGTYSVTATDVFGRQYADTINIGIPDIAPPPATSFCLGDSMRWNVDLGPAYTYLFSTGSTDPAIIISTPGTYYVTISDSTPAILGGPCSISDTIIVTVDSFRILASLGPDTSLCRGQQLGLSTQVSNTQSYLWSTGSTDSTITITAAGYYSVIATSFIGCTAYDTIYVNTSGQIADVDFAINSVYCFGDTIEFNNLTTIGAPYQILSYFWEFGDNSTDTLIVPSHVYGAPGTYTVSLTVAADSGCVNATSKTLTVNELPVPLYTYTTACAGSDVNFQDWSTSILSDPITKWYWNFGDGDTTSTRNPIHIYANAGIYYVTLTVTTQNGCPQSFTDTIEVFPRLIADIGAENFCKGQTVQFYDASPGFSNINWLWDFGDVSFSLDKNPTHTYGRTGDYIVTLTVTNALGCRATDQDTITIYDPPVTNFSTIPACANQPFFFFEQTAVVGDDSVTSRLWDFGDSTSTSVKRNPYHIYADTGSYQVTLHVTTINGCQHTVTKTVTVSGPPVAEFTFTPDYGGAPLEVTFTDASTDAISYFWDFGDNTANSTDQNPLHTYTSNGVFIVTLIVTNAEGCSDTVQHQLEVSPSSLDLMIDQIEVERDGDRWNMRALIINVGTRRVNDFEVVASIGNGSTVIEISNDTMVSGQVMWYDLGAHYFTTAEDQTYICIETQLPNGETDENPLNNKQCTTLESDLRIVGPSPNPANGYIVFGMVMPYEETVNVSVVDAWGQDLGVVYTGTLAEGLTQWQVNTSLLAEGVYLFRIEFKGETRIVKFVVER